MECGLCTKLVWMIGHGLVTCIDMSPLVALDAADVPDEDAEGLVANLIVPLAVALARCVVLALPLELVLRLVVLALALFLGPWWRLVHEVHAESLLAVFAQHGSAIIDGFISITIHI